MQIVSFCLLCFKEQIALFSIVCLLGGCLSQHVMHQTLSHSNYPKTNYAMVLYLIRMEDIFSLRWLRGPFERSHNQVSHPTSLAMATGQAMNL